ncbi:MAG TPA: O-antigen ligase family protein [Solirubrobacterales bacterium]|nr:O-antigen ligase family protein [Solirubrobacterales bacterium]
MSDVLAALGLLAAAAGAAGAILLPAGRLRSLAMLAALILFPVLILGDQWHSHQIADLRDSPMRLALLGALAVGASVALAYVFKRWPILLPLAIVAALPFRVPLHAGGDTANLLVPLYLVIAGGVLARLLPGGGAVGGPTSEDALATGRGGGSPAATGPAGPATWVPRLLAVVVVLFALQTLYSADFSKGLQNACFFFVPFSLVYGLLRDVTWDRRSLTLTLWVIGISATCFVLVGTIEWATRSLFWNDQVIRSNEFHTYFRVNSVFWDPNIYGRYLALVAVVAMSALLWARQRRSLALLTALVAVVWFGLVPTFSQSSYAALLAGLVVLAALRWSVKWTAIAAVAGVAATMLIVTLAGSFSFDRINIDTSGRANLVSGGIHLFAQRPLYGYGSGSFPKAYREHIDTEKAPVSVSHTEPITIAAEQGLVGLAAYVALVAAALWTMGRGLLRRLSVARAAVLAAFVALLVHTMAYAGFFEDPIAWVLLAAAVSLAASAAPGRRAEAGEAVPASAGG